MFSSERAEELVREPGDKEIDFPEVAKAIRGYLKYEYANYKLGLVHEPTPMRLSAFNAKGVGRYQTADDGRPDWSPEFARFIYRSEGRDSEFVELHFTFAEVDRAMDALQAKHPLWFEVVMLVDVHGQSVDEAVETFKKDVSSIKRYRTKATLFLFRSLVASPYKSLRRVPFKIIEVS